MEKSLPELVSKYLYVGATGVATNFGLCCKSSLPELLNPLGATFIKNWE